VLVKCLSLFNRDYAIRMCIRFDRVSDEINYVITKNRSINVDFMS